MIQELIAPRIELLQEQIDNLQQSGFYTESEMDSLSSPLRAELDLLKDYLLFEFLTIAELQKLQTRIHHAIITKREPSPFMKLKADGLAIAKDFLSPKANHYGMSDQEYADAKYKHNMFFNPIKALELEVVDAEILTPNHQEV
jgi:hypothetical protein